MWFFKRWIGLIGKCRLDYNWTKIYIFDSFSDPIYFTGVSVPVRDMNLSRTVDATETQLLRSSLQFRFISACLKYGWIACVITFFTTVIWFPPTRFYAEGAGVILLGTMFLFLQNYVLPRVQNFQQLDLVSIALISPAWILVNVTLFVSESEVSLATAVMLVAISAVLFYRDMIYWPWLFFASVVYVSSRYLTDKPMTRYDWTHVVLLMPLISVIFRSTVNASFRELVSKNWERSRLVDELSTTIEKLRVEEAESLRSRQELLAKDARLKLVLKNAPLFLWCVDKHDRITELEGSVFERKFENADQMVGGNFSQLSFECQGIVDAIELVKRDGKSLNVRLNCDQGSVFEVRLEPLLDDNGLQSGMVGVGLDVTESVRADVQKLELQQTLFHVQKMESLGLLAGGVAHDFNNYLMAIVAFSESLAARGIEDTNVEKIKKTAMQASGICEQLLVYSGKQSNEQMKKKQIDINQLVRDIQPLIEAVVPKEIELGFEFGPAGVIVNVMRGQIHQVVINMIKNSVEAIEDSSHGLITIRTGSDFDKSSNAQFFGEYNPSQSYCWLEISDNGIGIEPENLARVADLYYTTKISGHGFGMAVAARLVKDHDGCMEVEGQPGTGTAVRIILPIKKTQGYDGTVSINEESGWLPSISNSGFHVLLVDDEPAVLEAVQLVLQSQGHTVSAANSAQTALNMLEEKSDEIDCIVSDYTMPQINGLRFGEMVRSSGGEQPFVLCSGYALPVDMAANEFVPDLVLVKPYQPKALDEIVRKICGDSEVTESNANMIRPA